MSGNPKMCFINLPVQNLPRAMEFYTAVGFTNNPQFTDETAAAMAWSDTIVVMLLTPEKWHFFNKRPIAASDVSEVMIALSMESKAAVQQMIDAAMQAGGLADPIPAQDYDFMMSRSFADPDGHIWEAMWMNPEGMR